MGQAEAGVIRDVTVAGGSYTSFTPGLSHSQGEGFRNVHRSRCTVPKEHDYHSGLVHAFEEAFSIW